jgi:nitrate reductase delta subunit
MALEPIQQRVFHLFAELFEYPGTDLLRSVRECQALASLCAPPAARLLDEFAGLVAATPRARLEEIYSSTFDLNPACYPYVGYHLLGESYKRSVFLLRLKECFRAEGFDPGTELPDHLAVLLRFLAVTRDPELAEELVHQAVRPALERITGRARSAGFDDEAGGVAEMGDESPPNHPYRQPLEALRLVTHAISSRDGTIAPSEDASGRQGAEATVGPAPGAR